MTRLWSWEKRLTGPGTSNASPAAGRDGPTSVLAPDPALTPYVTHRVRPSLQYAGRIGLWAAVGLGCVGGIVALVRPSNADVVRSATPTSGDEAAVPGPVTGMAERVAEEWLTATDDDQERLDALFVEPPAANASPGETLEVQRVTSVAGRRMAAGYWSVTVAADVVELVPDEPVAREGDEPLVVPRETTWYLQVGIVGDVREGLAALEIPAVMPAPPEVSSAWEVVEGSSLPQDQEDVVMATVEGFLDALLAGGGDPQRYTAPGLELRAPEPAPFEAVSVEDVVVADVPETEGRLWVEAQVLATTTTGAERVFSYDLLLDPRVDRWEVVSLSGVPTFVEPSAPPDDRRPPATGGTDRP